MSSSTFATAAGSSPAAAIAMRSGASRGRRLFSNLKYPSWLRLFTTLADENHSWTSLLVPAGAAANRSSTPSISSQ